MKLSELIERLQKMQGMVESVESDGSEFDCEVYMETKIGYCVREIKEVNMCCDSELGGLYVAISDVESD